MPIRLAIGAAAALVVATGVALSGTSFPSALNAHAAVTAALPAGRLEFGLSNNDTTWMKASGVPWRYRFTYLSGGVNVQNNWLTWQDPAKPPGQYALDYMTLSTASPANYIPVFTWYQLLQSLPSTGATELDRDYNNLNNSATMSSYYASFKVLMQKSAQYGGPVVVHIEPDFWGYMQQKAAGGGASSISAMVKSSGFAEAAAFPDNLVGFASELKFLRDTYAPNALLAMHASMWSSGIDLASNTDPNLNPIAEADKTSTFLNSAGAASWDAVFNDVDDHNAAWWELASCGTPPCVNQLFTHWWDTNNVKFPNFNRYLSWVAELHARTALPQVVWQVPMGNQYFLTVNNTCGHYQDNVAPYFIAHAGALFNAGLIAALFGPGNQCQTNYDDSQKDLITNNNGLPTTDSLGGCNGCNTNTSVWSDDDGGYLRIFVGRYYAGQSSCLTAGMSATPSSPQTSGSSIVLSAASAGCPNPLYQFWILPPGASSWQVVQPYSTNSSVTWSTGGLAAGTYGLDVWVRDASSTGSYGNAAGRWDAYSLLQYNLTSNLGVPCASVSLSASPPGSASAGTPISVTAQAAGCPNPVYQFWTLAPGAGSWQLAQAYSTTRVLPWSTTGLPAGSYGIAVWVRDSSSSGAYGNSFGRWDTSSAMTFSLTAGAGPTCTSTALSFAPPGSASIGASVTIAAQAAGCPNPLYQFWVLPPGATAYQIVQAYSTSGSLTWSTAGKAPGAYQVAVWARDASSAGAAGNSLGTWDAATARPYTVTSCTGLSLTALPASTTTVGTSVTFTATAMGCPSPSPVYQFWILAPGASSWAVVQAYSTSNTLIWSTTGKATGAYQVAVWARDASSAGAAGNTFGTWDAFTSSHYSLV